MKVTRGWIGLAALQCLVMTTWGSPALGQQREQPGVAGTSPNRSEGPRPYLFGARYCAACHDQGRHPTYTEAERTSMVCGMDEFPIFDSRDPHKLAHSALTNDRGREMSKRLGRDVAQIDACLNCHSTRDQGIGKQQYTRTDRRCDVCDVPRTLCRVGREASGNRQRRMAPPRPESEGTRVWHDRLARPDPPRASCAASCHIGNDSQGKVITHAMYAAGHPPLAGFEAAAFGDQQPRHWKSAHEALERRGSEKTRPDSQLEQPGTSSTCRRGRAGRASRVHEAFRRPGRRRNSGSQDGPLAGVGSVRLPGLSSRPEIGRRESVAADARSRRSHGSAGRCRMAPGDVPVAIEAANTQKATARITEWNERLDVFRKRRWRRSLLVTPIAPWRLREIVQWSDGVLAELRQTPVSRDDVRVLLNLLCRTARDRVPDYDSARQIAWAFRAIYQELSRPERRRTDRSLLV